MLLLTSLLGPVIIEQLLGFVCCIQLQYGYGKTVRIQKSIIEAFNLKVHFNDNIMLY